MLEILIGLPSRFSLNNYCLFLEIAGMASNTGATASPPSKIVLMMTKADPISGYTCMDLIIILITRVFHD